MCVHSTTRCLLPSRIALLLLFQFFLSQSLLQKGPHSLLLHVDGAIPGRGFDSLLLTDGVGGVQLVAIAVDVVFVGLAAELLLALRL